MAASVRTSADIRQLVARSPMSTHQLLAIMVCVGLNMLDGFDILVMSFTASGVSAEWKLSGARLGWLFSAGLIGMATGSLFLAPRADRFGRRTVVMAAVLLVSVGMALSGMANEFWQLCALRALTGIGIGGILAGATVLVAEYASDRWRNTASYLYTSGYSIGGTLGGGIAAILIARYGWRSAFALGAVASFVMLPLSYWGLPESLDFLVTRRPAGALHKLNRLLTSMHHAQVAALPELDIGSAAPHAAVGRLFAGGMGRSTVLIWLAFFFVMSGYYFVFSWTPKLLTAGGLSVQQGITSGVLLSLGGIAGTVLFAFIAKAFDVRGLISFCLVISSVLMGIFAMTTGNVAASLLIGVGLGAMATSAMAGFYALTPALYPPDLRTTGMGWGIGIGRIGAILAPLLTGVLVDRGWSTVSLYWVFAATFIVSALALAGMVPGVGRARIVRELG